MPKIAELTIEIKNDADSAVASLKKLKGKLNDIGKINLDFSNIKTGNLQNLYKYVSSLTRVLTPLEAQCATIGQAFTAMGATSSASMKKVSNDAQEMKTALAEVGEVKPKAVTTEQPKPEPVQLEVRGQSAIEASIGRLSELKVMMREVRANGDLNSPETQAQVLRLNEAIKAESSELRRLQGEANGAGSATKGMGNKMASATSMVKKIAPVLKSVKSALKSFGSAFSGLGKSIKGINLPFTGLLKQFGRMFRLKAMRMMIQQVMLAFKEGTDNLYEYSRALNSTDSANFKNVMDQYNSALLKLKNSIGAAVAPLLQQLLPVVQTVIATLIRALNLLNQFISLLQGKKTYTRATDYMAEYKAGVDGATGSVKELRRTLLGFDEIHRLDMETPSSGGGGGSPGADASQMFEEAVIDSDISKFFDDLKKQFDKLGIEQKIKNIKKAWEDVKSAVVDLVTNESFQYLVGTVFSMALTGIEGLLKSVKGIIDGIRKAIEDLDKNGKIDALRAGWENVSKTVSDFFNSEGFQGLLSTVIDLGVTGLTGLFETLASVINNVVKPALDELNENGTFDQIKKAWGEIWESIKNISESELFKALLKDSLVVTVEAIANAMQTIADALQLIDDILSLDLTGILKDIGKLFLDILEIPGKIITTLVDKLNELRGQKTNNYGAWVSTVNAGRYMLENDVPLTDALEITGAINFETGLVDDSYTLSNFTAKLQNMFNELPENARTLKFKAWITDNASELASWYKNHPWESASDEEKELAYKAYISTMGKDLAREFKYKSWDQMPDSDRMLAWACLITTDPADLVEEVEKGWNASKMPLATEAELNEKLSKKNLERGVSKAWAETTNKNKLYAPVSLEDKVGRVLTEQLDNSWDANKKPLNADVESFTSKGNNAWTQFKNRWTGVKTDLLATVENFTSKGGNAWSQFSTKWGVAKVDLKASVENFTNNASNAWTQFKTQWGSPSVGVDAKATMVTKPSSLMETITTGWKGLADATKTVNIFSKIATNASTMWTDVSDRWGIDDAKVNGGKHMFTIQSKISTYASTMWKKVKGDWDTETEYKSFGVNVYPNLDSTTLKGQAKSAFNDITVAVTGAGDLKKIAGNLYFQAYAQGGFPDTGQLFIANEAGAEMVGQIGSRTAVANTQQIVDGIAYGVSQAMQSQNALLSRQNDLLAQIARKDSSVSISSILGAMDRANKRTGTPVVQMG